MVWEFSQASAQKIFKSEAKVHYIYFDEKPDTKAKDAMKPAAKEYKGKVAFVTVDTSDASVKNVLGFFGVKEDETPRSAIFEVILKLKLNGQISHFSVFADGC